MDLTEVELREKLVEVGNRLLDLPSDANELYSLLDQIESFLSKVEQSPKESISAALLPSMKALAAKKLLRHSDMDVKVAVTSSICEIMRITAPEAPYDDELMKQIFELIVEAFKGLDDFLGRSYLKRAMILESVAKVRSFLLMLDLQCDELIVRMFQCFFDVIREGHSDMVFKAMETVMTLTLEESEDISSNIASCLLSSVLKNNKGTLPVASILGERVLRNCSKILKPSLIEVMTSSGARYNDYSEVVASICKGNTSKTKNILSKLSKKSLLGNGRISGRTTSEEHLQACNHGSSSLDMDGGYKAEKSSKTVISKDHIIKKKKGLKLHSDKAQQNYGKDFALHQHKELNNKTSSAGPIPTETPDITRPKRGRPPGSKTKSSCDTKQPAFVDRKATSDGEHSHKQENHMTKHLKGTISSDKSKSRRPNKKDPVFHEKLIGSAIKVYWPEDDMFYRGVVDSYDPSSMKHRVLYADGDVENLVLKKERWKFVDSELSSDEEGSEDLINSNSPLIERPKKKVKPNSNLGRKQMKDDLPVRKIPSDTSSGSMKRLHGASDSSSKSKQKTADVPVGSPISVTKIKVENVEPKLETSEGSHMLEDHISKVDYSEGNFLNTVDASNDEKHNDATESPSNRVALTR